MIESELSPAPKNNGVGGVCPNHGKMTLEDVADDRNNEKNSLKDARKCSCNKQVSQRSERVVKKKTVIP